MQPSIVSSDRISGLDSIRFVCALWVFFGHGGAPHLLVPKDGSVLILAWRAFYGNIFFGPAAVIVFFVISGFCIHYPFAGSRECPQLQEFYARRFVRIIIPVIVAIPLCKLVGVHLNLFHETILWSLFAELIYYACYPALRVAQLRLGSWRGLIIASYVMALAVAATNPSAGNYPSYGVALNWVLGLPCWLLGCYLAEEVRKGTVREVSVTAIWAWRGAIFSAAWVCSALRFHSPVGYPWTLNLFAVLVALWLYKEIAFRRRIAPPRALEWAGVWSYSLYLLHFSAGLLFERLFPSLSDSPFRWLLTVLFVLFACYLFYLVVERPGHWIARQAAHKVRV